MPEPVTIPISFFELVSVYEHPDLRLWMDRANVTQEVFSALSSWSPSIDDIEVMEQGRPSEQGITIKLPLKRIAFFFGPAFCKYSRDGVSWQSAEETLKILDAATSALTRASGASIAVRKTAVTMHIQPRNVRFLDILRPFLVNELAALEEEPITAMAVVSKWKSRRVTIDGSASVANGVFLGLDREFAGTVPYDEIANQLREDQYRLFELLGVEEVQG